MEHLELILAAIGGIFIVLRTIVYLTPTPKDDQLFNRAFSVWQKVLGIVAKGAGIDTTQGVSDKKPWNPNVPTILLLFLIPAFALESGCGVYNDLQTTERSRLLTAQKTFASTVRGVTIMLEDWKLDDAEIARVDILIEQINGFLKEWEIAVAKNERSPAVADMVIQLIAELGKYQFERVK